MGIQKELAILMEELREIAIDIAKEAGADHVIVGRDADFAREVAALTDGRGADVAYDGVGGSTLLKTLDCVRGTFQTSEIDPTLEAFESTRERVVVAA